MSDFTTRQMVRIQRVVEYENAHEGTTLSAQEWITTVVRRRVEELERDQYMDGRQEAERAAEVEFRQQNREPL